MLKEIKINNYALIDSIEMSFKSGMTSITGETGAGKSILLGGLSLVLGSRVDNSKIINKDTKCFVEAIFDIGEYDLKTFFVINSLDYEKETILRREVIPSGKSRAFINDTPVNLDVLSKLGNNLIDIHSQHNYLNILDKYNKNKLVPFGEFLPFENFFSKFGLKKITQGYQSFSSGNKREIINIFNNWKRKWENRNE